MRALALRILTLSLALALFLVTGEVALRVVYRDGGSRTLGGPGGHPFDHLTRPGSLRGRYDDGPKRPGVSRLMVLGDSITWGKGVRDWHQTWPELLFRMFNRAGNPHELAVVAQPGWDIDVLARHFDETAPAIRPDTLIYQWYINDIEVTQHRPRSSRWWQTNALHGALVDWSYLFYFLDNRLSTLLPPPERSYVDYILQDFVPGSLEWTEFERYFHWLGARARELAAHRLIVLYPQVPFRGAYPLQSIHDRIRALAGPHRLSIPPAAWEHDLPYDNRPDAPWGTALHVATGIRGAVATTREYYLPAGGTRVVLTMATEARRASAPATLVLLGDQDDEPVATVTVRASGQDGWQDVPIDITVPAGRAGLFRLQIRASGEVPFALASIDLEENYEFSVLDLTPDLNTFDTHVSIFDAHPNEAAQRVMASRIFAAVSALEHASVPGAPLD